MQLQCRETGCVPKPPGTILQQRLNCGCSMQASDRAGGRSRRSLSNMKKGGDRATESGDLIGKRIAWCLWVTLVSGDFTQNSDSLLHESKGQSFEAQLQPL